MNKFVDRIDGVLKRELLKKKWTVLTNDQKQPILILINNYYEKQKG